MKRRIEYSDKNVFVMSLLRHYRRLLLKQYPPLPNPKARQKRLYHDQNTFMLLFVSSVYSGSRCLYCRGLLYTLSHNNLPPLIFRTACRTIASSWKGCIACLVCFERFIEMSSLLIFLYSLQKVTSYFRSLRDRLLRTSHFDLQSSHSERPTDQTQLEHHSCIC